MEYLLRYVFTEREYAKLVSRLAHKDVSSQKPPSPHVIETRQFVRLFLKAWVLGFAAKKLTKRSIDQTQLASTLVACAVSYRYLYRYVSKRPPPQRGQPQSGLDLAKYAAPIGGFVAGAVLSRGLSTGASCYAAIYLASKVGEWLYNAGDDAHKFDWKPQLLGTWALFPLAFAQLFQSYVFAPDQCPSGFKRVMAALSNGAFTTLDEPDNIVVGITQASRDQFPEPGSGVVYRSHVTTSRLVFRTHATPPASGATLALPAVDSELRFFVNTIGTNMTLFAKYILPVYLIRAYLGRKSYREAFMAALRAAIAYSMTAACSIAGIRVSERVLGRKLSPRLRLGVVGLLSGLWAVVNQERGRAQFLYAARLAVLSLVPPHSQQSVARILLPLSMSAAFTLLNYHPEAVSQGFWRKLGNWMQDGDWTHNIGSQSERTRPDQ